MSFTPIKLDKTRNLRFGMKALHLIEKSGVSLAKLDNEELTMEQIATVIWAGLSHEDKELTPEKVMDLVDEHSDLATVLESMGKAFEDSFGKNGQRVAPTKKANSASSKP